MKEMRKVLKGWNLNFEANLKRQKKLLIEVLDRLDKQGENGIVRNNDKEYKKAWQDDLKIILKEE